MGLGCRKRIRQRIKALPRSASRPDRERQGHDLGLAALAGGRQRGRVAPAIMSSVPAPSPAAGSGTSPIPSAPALGEAIPSQPQRDRHPGCRTLLTRCLAEFLMRVWRRAGSQWISETINARRIATTQTPPFKRLNRQRAANVRGAVRVDGDGDVTISKLPGSTLKVVAIHLRTSGRANVVRSSQRVRPSLSVSATQAQFQSSHGVFTATRIEAPRSSCAECHFRRSRHMM